jgi:hypothetical protein
MMLQKWENEDRAVRPPGAPYATLKMKQPGVVTNAIVSRVFNSIARLC